MFDFLNLKPEAFALDISDFSLKIVKLEQKRNVLNLVSFGSTEMEPGIVQNGEIKDQDRLAEIIKGTIENINGEKLKTKYVIVSLPEEKTFLQVIQMPQMSDEDLKSAIIYQAENYIPLPIEEVYLDFQTIPLFSTYPFGQNKKSEINEVQKIDHLDVLLAALPRKTVDPYLSTLKKAGLKPKILETELLAASRALIKDGLATSPVLLIDLGASRTNFGVFSGYSLRFTSSIAVSSREFTKIISSNLGISFKEAEELKIKYGLEEKVKLKLKNEGFERITERGRIFESLVPALVDLVQQIKKYLDYYQTHASHEHLPSENKGVSKIILCGGGSYLKGLTELLSLELKIPVELGDPLINIFPEERKEIPGFSFGESLKYTVALGLALRGISGE